MVMYICPCFYVYAATKLCFGSLELHLSIMYTLVGMPTSGKPISYNASYAIDSHVGDFHAHFHGLHCASIYILHCTSSYNIWDYDGKHGVSRVHIKDRNLRSSQHAAAYFLQTKTLLGNSQVMFHNLNALGRCGVVARVSQAHLVVGFDA